MNALAAIEQTQRKAAVPQVQSGDTVRVHQLIREGNKQRVQVFEGVVIRTHRMNSATAVITVRRIASNVGVEKTFMLHSPNVEKVQVVRRAKVRRNFLSYLRERRGKSARLAELTFDREAVNVKDAPKVDPAQVAEAAANNEVAELAVEQAADDAEVTEIAETSSEEATESIDEVVKEENKEAAEEAAPATADDAGEQGDEDAAREEEVQEGLDKAAKETDE
jgi:large subunit ribosomal protein L19